MPDLIVDILSEVDLARQRAFKFDRRRQRVDASTFQTHPVSGAY